jgi:hypothetical protein
MRLVEQFIDTVFVGSCATASIGVLPNARMGQCGSSLTTKSNELTARFEVGMNQTNAAIPSSYAIGQEIKWVAPWIEVYLWVELPFWLMTGNTTVSVEVGGHDFEIAIHENYLN